MTAKITIPMFTFIGLRYSFMLLTFFFLRFFAKTTPPYKSPGRLIRGFRE